MPITIGTNIASLLAQRRLGTATEQLSRATERLSSGQRINRAVDDAAGLAVSSSLRANARIDSQAIRNINDGVSTLNIAEGALQSLSEITNRLQELAEQAANGTYSTTQRAALNTEAQSLSAEFTRIAQSTKFNGLPILDGTIGTIGLQVGLDGTANSQIAVSISAATALVGNGTFQDGVAAAGAFQGTRGIVEDVNGDGVKDAILSSSNNTFKVMIGNGDGTFRIGGTYTNAGSSSGYEFRMADLNGDGVKDIVAGDLGDAYFILTGNANGSFSASVSYQVDSNPTFRGNLHDIGDFDGDGKIDIALSDGTNMRVAFGNGNGTFTQAFDTGVANNHTYGSAAGDFMGNGRYQISGTYGVISVSTGRTFSVVGVAPGQDSTVVGDLNNDGKQDIVSFNYYTRLGNGDGTFRIINPAPAYPGGGVPRNLSIADLNGDGKLDLVATPYLGGGTVAYLGNGDGTFRLAFTQATGFAVDPESSTLVGDFTGDGVDDFMYLANSSANSRIYASNTTTGPLRINISLLTQSAARTAIASLATAQTSLATALGQVGGSQSRLHHAMNIAQIMRENLSAAASRIVDADISEESANAVRAQILQQSSLAILAQANLQPQIAIKLLQTI